MVLKQDPSADGGYAMRRLTTPLSSDRGAVAVLVAILFGFGVMLGAGALTVDVGNINADRRQLQNGPETEKNRDQDCHGAAIT